MSIRRKLYAPPTSPLVFAEALTQRSVGYSDFLGASFGLSQEDSLGGIALRGVPQLLTTPARQEAEVQARLAEIPAGQTLTEQDRATFAANPDTRPLVMPPDRQEIEANLRVTLAQRYEQEQREFTPIDQATWAASENFREGIPYEDGMTEERAAGLADYYDDQRFREWLIENHDGGVFSAVSGFVAGVAGGALSPENFIPFAGPAMRAAAIARLGSIGGRAAVAAFEGALGTAAVLPFIARSRATIGDEMTWSDALLEIGMGAAAGAVIGGVTGVGARRGDVRRGTALSGERVMLTRIDAAEEAITTTEIARRQLMAGEMIDVPPLSDRTVDALLEGMSRQELVRTLRATHPDAVARATDVPDAGVALSRVVAEDARAAGRGEQTALTAVEEASVHGETQQVRDAARQELDDSRNARVAGREATPAEVLAREIVTATRVADDAVAARAVDAAGGVSRETSRVRPVRLNKLERLALFDQSPKVQAAARAILDQRIERAAGRTVKRALSVKGAGRVFGKPSKGAAKGADTVTRTGDPAADIDVQAEIKRIAELGGIDENGNFAELAQWKQMDELGDALASERAGVDAADVEVKKAAKAAETYDAAAMCIIGAG